MNKTLCFSAIVIMLILAPVMQAGAQEAMVIDDFDNLLTWKSDAFEGNTIELKQVKGKDGNALELDYDLKNTNQWVQVNRAFNLKLPKEYSLKLLYKVSGNENILEIKLVDEDGSNFGYKMPLVQTKGWQEAEIKSSDISYWWGGDNKQDQIKSIYFAVSTRQGGAGKVDLDKLTFIEKESGPQIQNGVLDNFDSIEGWSKNKHEDAQINLSTVKGKEGKAVVIEYDLGQKGEWVVVEKDFMLPPIVDEVFSFWLKAEGDKNKLEFKVVDADGSVFGKRIEAIKSGWDKTIVKPDELEYWWGGNNQLDEIVKISIAVSRIDRGKGKVYIDELEFKK